MPRTNFQDLLDAGSHFGHLKRKWNPKMAPYIQNMREALACTLNISVDLINVKATTEEKLGFTGNKEGIAAHSVCLLKNKE